MVMNPARDLATPTLAIVEYNKVINKETLMVITISVRQLLLGIYVFFLGLNGLLDRPIQGKWLAIVAVVAGLLYILESLGVFNLNVPLRRNNTPSQA